MLGGVEAHDQVAPRPVDDAVHPLADVGEGGIGSERVPDHALLVLGDVDDGRRPPADDQLTAVVRLPAARGEEEGGVESDGVLVLVDGDDAGVELLPVGVVEVEKLGRHHRRAFRRSPFRDTRGMP